MGLTRGAFKFALLVTAIVLAFAGATNINRSQAFDSEALKFSVETREELKPNGPTDVFTISLSFAPKLKSSAVVPELEISFINIELVAKGAGGQAVGEPVVLVRESNRLIKANQMITLPKPLNQSFPLFPSAAKTAEVVVTDLKARVVVELEAKSDDSKGRAKTGAGVAKPVSLGDFELSNQVIHVANLAAEPLPIEQSAETTLPSQVPAGALATPPPSGPTPTASPTQTTAPTPTPTASPNAPPTATSPAEPVQVPLLQQVPEQVSQVSTLPTVAIQSVDVAQAPQGKRSVTVKGATTPNTLVVVTIQSTPRMFQVLSDSEGNFIVRAELQLRPGPHQVFAKAITPDALEVGPVSTTVEFTVPKTEFSTIADQLIGGGMVMLGVVLSILGLLL